MIILNRIDILCGCLGALLLGASGSAQSGEPAEAGRAKGGEPTLGLRPLLELRHWGAVASLAYSPDGKLLAAGSGFRGIILWDSASGRELSRFTGPDVGCYVAFAPDGHQLASATNWRYDKAGGLIQFREVATGRLTGDFSAHDGLVRCIAFGPDGRSFASGGEDRTIRLWDVLTGEEVFRLAPRSYGHAIAFSPDGRHLAFDIDHAVRICDAATGRELRRLEGHQAVHGPKGSITSGYINGLAFSHDAQRIASASCDNTTRLWDVPSGKLLHVLEGHDGFVNTVMFLPGDRLVATGGEDGTLRFWDVRTGKQTCKVQAHHARQDMPRESRKDIFALALSPDGKRLASGGRDGAVRIWELSPFLK